MNNPYHIYDCFVHGWSCAGTPCPQCNPPRDQRLNTYNPPASVFMKVSLTDEDIKRIAKALAEELKKDSSIEQEGSK